MDQSWIESQGEDSGSTIRLDQTHVDSEMNKQEYHRSNMHMLQIMPEND